MHIIPCVTLAAVLALPAFAAAPAESKTLLKTGSTWDGRPITYLQTNKPEIQTLLIEIPQGAATPWHQHPVNNIATILEGRLRLELKDGTTREFGQGESFAELVNTTHRGVNVGKGPLKILVVYIGAVGTPITVQNEARPGK